VARWTRLWAINSAARDMGRGDVGSWLMTEPRVERKVGWGRAGGAGDDL